MNRPDLVTPPRPYWEPIGHLDPGNYPYMSCHWSDVRDGYVVPKHKDQIFYFADLYEMWVFRGVPDLEPEPPQRSWWPERIIIIVGMILFGVDLWLAWHLFNRLEWL